MFHRIIAKYLQKKQSWAGTLRFGGSNFMAKNIALSSLILQIKLK